MRGRPLFCFCLLYVLFTGLYLYIFPPETPSLGGLEGQKICLMGTAEDVWNPAEDTGEGSCILYLKEIYLLSNSKTVSQALAAESQAISDTIQKNPIEDLISHPSAKKWKFKMICYLAEGEVLPVPGEKVILEGTLRSFSSAANPGEFDAASFYQARGYGGQMFLTNILKIMDTEDGITSETGVLGKVKREWHANITAFKKVLYGFRNGARSVFYRLLGKKQASVLSAIVLGDKKSMDGDIKELYQDAGIAHILAISGLHISLLGRGIFKLGKRCRLPDVLNAFLALCFLGVYCLMTGMSLSAQRALIMFAFFCGAKICRRTPDTLTSAGAAAVYLLTKQPLYLFDSSFQLSFGAILGIGITVPFMEQFKKPQERIDRTWKDKFKEKFFSQCISTVAVNLTTLPIILYWFYDWNPWSFLANFFVLPLMGPLFGTAVVLAVVGYIFLLYFPAGLFLLKPPAFFCKILLWLFEAICEVAEKLPGSHLHLGCPKVWQIVLFLLLLTGLLMLAPRIKRQYGIVLAALLCLVFFIKPPESAQLTMLDVGQGECIYVQGERGLFSKENRWLIDVGSSSNAKAAQYQVIPYLEWKGVDRLEGIFISHWDEDHCNGLSKLLSWAQKEQVGIGQIFLPDISLQDDKLRELLAEISAYNIPVFRLTTGNTVKKRNISFTCLYPYEGLVTEDRNAASMVLVGELEGSHVLFMGDLEAEGEEWLIKNSPERLKDISVLKVGHHGSKTSSGEAFLSLVLPKLSLISCGRNNIYGHPSKEVLERLENIGSKYKVTAREGAVNVIFYEKEIRAESFLFID